nr:MAG TPA: Macrophage scavenger receptor [Caudoviricetes sp.]
MTMLCINYEHFMNFSTFQFSIIYENLRKLVQYLI